MAELEIYCREHQWIFAELGTHAVGTLATCTGDQPHARSVSCIFSDGKIYFQTDCTMEKAVQIRENNRVALCFRHIQIIGICTELGHPQLPENKDLFQTFQSCFPDAAAKYSMLENERFYLVTPCQMEVWQYIDGTPYIAYLDLGANRFQMKKYGP